MAKVRNSLGLLVLTAPVVQSPISWDEYKRKYGVDLSEIFTYVSGDGGGVRADFSKILCIDFRTAYKSENWTNASESLFQFPVEFTRYGDNDESLAWGVVALSLHIDTLNKTIQTVEN